MLPFARGDYEQDFAAGAPRDAFHALLAQAQSVLELPGQRGAPLAAYVMAGRATVAHCDVLVAIWDGEPPRGRGGTGEVVEIALLAGTPILHIPIDPAAPLRLLWSGLDPHVCTTRENCHAAAVPLQRRGTRAGAERAAAAPRRPARTRLHPRLLSRARAAAPPAARISAAARRSPGSARMGRASVRPTPMHQALDSEWQAFRDGVQRSGMA